MQLLLEIYTIRAVARVRVQTGVLRRVTLRTGAAPATRGAQHPQHPRRYGPAYHTLNLSLHYHEIFDTVFDQHRSVARFFASTCTGGYVTPYQCVNFGQRPSNSITLTGSPFCIYTAVSDVILASSSIIESDSSPFFRIWSWTRIQKNSDSNQGSRHWV